jgi:predicted NAD/FAD-binding protein
VTLFEAESSCGGHTLTDSTGQRPVDLGFQVSFIQVQLLAQLMGTSEKAVVTAVYWSPEPLFTVFQSL